MLQIEFKDVKMRYRPGLPLVLKGLNVSIEAGTTCGVVGRTGSFPLLESAQCLSTQCCCSLCCNLKLSGSDDRSR